MNWTDQERVESNHLDDFARVMGAGITSPSRFPAGELEAADPGAARVNLDGKNVKNGLGRLVLTLVKLLHELLEREAIKQIDAGYLTDAEIERVGLTLMEQVREIDRLRREFHLDEEDLNLDLGPLGKLF
ncbi:MAG: gas vesicle protein K [Syntrophobacteraceae bacterium]